MWQDIVLTAGSVIFILALLPSVFSADKPATSTSAMTAFVLYIFAAVDVTLDLKFTAATTAVTASLWVALLLQKLRSA